MHEKNHHGIRTYMSYSLPLDPAKIYSLEDLDLSRALGSTLVTLNSTYEPVSGLAKSWDYPSDNEVAFHLSSHAKWANGDPITPEQVRKSFLRAKRIYGTELDSLFDLIKSIHVADNNTVVFTLTTRSAGSGLVRKLTECAYGVAFVNEDDSLDLSKSSGPFFVRSASADEISLEINRNWYQHIPEMAQEVRVRQRPKTFSTGSDFMDDSWANLATTTSLSPIPKEKLVGRPPP